jgi:hypothetical protein
MFESTVEHGEARRLKEQHGMECGIGVRAWQACDIDTLGALRRAGYSSDTIGVIDVAPLIEVAWADGHITPGERLSILEQAVACGIDGGPAYQWLLDLLAQHPSRHFFTASLSAIRVGLSAAPPEERRNAERRLAALCVAIATASRSAAGRRIAAWERGAIRRILAAITR